MDQSVDHLGSTRKIEKTAWTLFRWADLLEEPESHSGEDDAVKLLPRTDPAEDTEDRAAAGGHCRDDPRRN